ncbi:MAG: ribosome biogenesis GTPase Der [Anaerolineae bacterium]|nr:ribosome biogenesis GTPase Der [Anaerolineae bacterium]
MPKPLVAIVGRPNVGKSTLFNRIIGERRAVVSEIPGTTRDRVIAETEWEGRQFLVADTGGIEVQPPTVTAGRRPDQREVLLEDSAEFIPLIREQAEQAIGEADVVLFLTDVISGLTGADREVADILRRTTKPVLLVVNKADNQRRDQEAFEFYELGMGEILPISAIHGHGVGELLDKVVEILPEETASTESDEEVLRIAILGRPNVGKSSLLNQLIGEKRAIVSPVAGTTRDALDTEFEWEGQKIVLIDTAGIRRRGKIEQGIEKYSVLRSARSLQRADVALLMLDALDGDVTAQDAHIGGMIAEQGVSAVILVNKWDVADRELKQNRLEYEKKIRYDLKFMPYVPVLFISALTGSRTNQVLPTALEVAQARYQRIPTGTLNDMIHQAFAEHAPPSKRGKRLKVYYVTQAEVAPPMFILFVNDPELVHFSYQRYLENRIRELFPFPGTPIRMTFRGHQKDLEGKKLKRKQK